MSEFNLDCPSCKSKVLIDGEDLPDRACDDTEIECERCGELFNVGWYAEVELR